MQRGAWSSKSRRRFRDQCVGLLLRETRTPRPILLSYLLLSASLTCRTTGSTRDRVPGQMHMCDRSSPSTMRIPVLHAINATRDDNPLQALVHFMPFLHSDGQNPDLTPSRTSRRNAEVYLSTFMCRREAGTIKHGTVRDACVLHTERYEIRD
jgi:hypothetical protein